MCVAQVVYTENLYDFKVNSKNVQFYNLNAVLFFLVEKFEQLYYLIVDFLK